MKTVVKKLLTKVLLREPRFGTRVAITMPYTATRDGVLSVNLASNGLGVLYISGEGDNRFLTYVGNTQQGDTTISAPVHKGQTYSVVYSSAIANVRYNFVPLEWGGVVHRLLNTLQSLTYRRAVIV